jgi:hypothetical protein
VRYPPAPNWEAVDTPIKGTKTDFPACPSRVENTLEKDLRKGSLPLIESITDSARIDGAVAMELAIVVYLVISG